MQLRTAIKYQLIFYYPCISNCAFFYYICHFLFSCLSKPRKIKTTTRRFTFQNHLINLIYKVHQLCRYLNGALQNKGKNTSLWQELFLFSSPLSRWLFPCCILRRNYSVSNKPRALSLVTFYPRSFNSNDTLKYALVGWCFCKVVNSYMCNNFR